MPKANAKTIYTATAPDGNVITFDRGGAEIAFVIVGRHTPSARKYTGLVGEPYGTYGEWHVSSMHGTRKAAEAKLAYYCGLDKFENCRGWEHQIVEAKKV